MFVMRTPLARPQGRRRRRVPVSSPSALAWHVVINPEIKHASPDQEVWLEACLSIPDYFALTRRRRRISVQYLTGEGKAVHTDLDGLAAAIFQHETDHLNGMLLMDREMPGSSQMDELDTITQQAEQRMMRAMQVEFGQNTYPEREGS
jgi:peptide deformylase